MNAINATNEKASVTIQIRVTPTEVQAFKKAAPNGNVSGWMKGMANEQARRVATKFPLTNAPVKR